MILPCRIRHPVPVFPVLLAVMVFAPAFLSSPFQATAQDAAASTFQAAGVSWLPAVPIGITAGVDAGYNDMLTLTSNAQGSFFSRENIVLTYSAASTRTQFYPLGVGRFPQFFDRAGEDDPSRKI